MSRRTRIWLLIIVVLAVPLGMVALTPAERIDFLGRDIRVRLGLDLSGGSQVLLEAEDCGGDDMAARLENARQIIENRVNGLGVSEPVVQVQGDCRMLVELPSVDNPADAIALIQQTGRLEWTDNGQDFYNDGDVIRTTGNPSPTVSSANTTGGNLNLPTGPLTNTAPLTPTAAIPDKVYDVIVTGSELDPARLVAGLGGAAQNEPQVQFQLMGDAAQRFAQYTAANVGSYACIVLDNVVQSCPVINSAIPDGQGVITVGSGGIEEASRLVNLLRYGALPVSLQVVQSNTIGPTLGEDSIRASLIAGIIGLSAVALFMLLYYRVAGFVAVITLTLYGLITFALFRLIPVTLTLPGIAGFILSVGVAVDGNTLIIERLKEELRAGRRLSIAVELGFDRAWSSIRDSNFATLITCAILWWFGSNFGASIVKGFALTLGVGVFISLFSSVFVTRTFLHLITDNIDLEGRPGMFGA